MLPPQPTQLNLTVLAFPRILSGDMDVQVYILNYNGRRLLAECLPSVLRAAERSRFACRVTIIDNASTDNSVAWLRGAFPQIEILERPNRGLCSFNDALATTTARVAVLLNNDIKLTDDCLDPLVAPLIEQPEANYFLTAPRCYLFDGKTYDGFKTSVRWRWGLVQATAIFAGHERVIDEPGPTASAGAAMAVDVEKYRRLGGFDPIYLPGRLEDLDFSFRAHQAGYRAIYVPESLCYHMGMATFGKVFGAAGCDYLALRNTLLFQWKNLRHPWHYLRQLVGLPMRLAMDALRAPMRAPQLRWPTWRAIRDAWTRLRNAESGWATRVDPAGERQFFTAFHPKRLARRQNHRLVQRRVVPLSRSVWQPAAAPCTAQR